jgi:hypothetical protein
MSRDTDFEHHQPRNIDKKKRHRAGFTEDVQDTRYTRISFKNYMRTLDEDALDVADEEWALERLIGTYQGDDHWSEVMVYPTEDEANAALAEYEKDAGYNEHDEDDFEPEQYRVRKLD